MDIHILGYQIRQDDATDVAKKTAPFLLFFAFLILKHIFKGKIANLIHLDQDLQMIHRKRLFFNKELKIILK
jgi:hypothetical protein